MLPKTPDAKKNIHFSALIDELPNEKIPLIIKSYGAKNDSVNTYPVLLSLPNLQQLKVDLLPGMLITVVAEYKTAESILENQFQIPLSAIWVSENQTKYVWVVDPLKMSVYKREVQIHPAHHQNTQIVKGLKKGEIIVTAGTHNLREGTKVKYYQQQPPH
jgi:multidrug efflux pump subunit AcrA (membrane-fusion protein)